MIRRLSQKLNARRIFKLGTALALAAALSGCVIYAGGPGFYHHGGFYGRDWH